MSASKLKMYEFMVRELETLTNRKVYFKKNMTECWLCCPFHASNLNSPSLRVRLDINDERFGRFKCYSCGEWKGGYNRLAAATGLRQMAGADTYDASIPTLAFNTAKPPTVTDLRHRVEDMIPRDAFPWPEFDNWRNINGACVAKRLGGMMYFDEYVGEPRLVFPARVNGKIVGSVRCNLVPQEGAPNYFNYPKGSDFNFKNFLFYDEAEALLKKLPKKDRVVVISEGPRDGANVMQFGVPGIVSLGAEHSWSKAKAYLVLAMSAERIILAFDGDDAGRKAAELAMADLAPYAEVYDLVLPYKVVKKEINGVMKNVRKKTLDPSDFTREQARALFDFRG